MAVPSFEKLLLPVLRILAQKNCSNLHEVREAVIKQFKFSREDAEETHASGQTKLANRISWSAHNLRKAELVDRPHRGVYCISEAGREYLKHNPEKEDLSNKDLESISPAFKKWWLQLRGKNKQISRAEPREEQRGLDQEETETLEEVLEETYAKLQRVLEEDLKERLLKSSPEFLERTAVKLLVAMRYGNTGERTGGPKDRGIDEIVLTDELGLKKIAIQTKRYKEGTKVRTKDMQKFLGSLDGMGINDGVFITTSTFTSDALDFIKEKKGSKSVILIDGERLTRLMFKHNIGASEKFKEFSYVIKKIDEDFFEEE